MIHVPENKWKEVVLSIVQAAAQEQLVQVIRPTTEGPLLLLLVAAEIRISVHHRNPAGAATIREHTKRLHGIVHHQVVPLTLPQAEVLPVLRMVGEVHLREVPDRQAADLRVAEAVVAAADKYKQYNHQR